MESFHRSSDIFKQSGASHQEQIRRLFNRERRRFAAQRFEFRMGGIETRLKRFIVGVGLSSIGISDRQDDFDPDLRVLAHQLSIERDYRGKSVLAFPLLFSHRFGNIRSAWVGSASEARALWLIPHKRAHRRIFFRAIISSTI